MRCAVVGCGRVFKHYQKTVFNNLPKSWSIDILIDEDPFNLSIAHGSFSDARKYSSILEANAHLNDITLAFILSYSGLHFEHSKFFLERGIDVVIEKPIAMNPSQIRKLYRIAECNNSHIYPVFQNRLNNAMVFAKNLITEGHLGEIISASGNLKWRRDESYYKSNSWRGTWKLDGGVLNNQAIHHLDAYVWLVGLPSRIQTLNRSNRNYIECEDTSVSIFEHNNGIMGTFMATTQTAFEDLEASIEIHGTTGYIKIGGVALNKIEFMRTKHLSRVPENIDEDFEDGYGKSHEKVIRKIIDSVEEKVDFFLSEKEAINTSILVNNMYYSSEIGNMVSTMEVNESKLLGK